MPNSKWLLLPGFLGAKEDFDELRTYLDFPTEAVDLPLTISDILKEGPRLSLIGDSMGGRIAIKLQKRFPEVIERVIALSSNPGLFDLEKRKAWEDKWLNQLKRAPLSHFLELWYEQPLFEEFKKHPSFPSMW